MAFKKSLILLALMAVLNSVQAQVSKVTLSGQVSSLPKKEMLPFVNVILKTEKDSAFVTGTITASDGRFTLSDIAPGNYLVEFASLGFQTIKMPVTVGALSAFLDLGVLEMSENAQVLQEVTVTGAQADGVDARLDRKVFDISKNISQSGGSILQALKNLPGVTAGEDGKVMLRGSDKVAVLIDGRQTALTGFGNQTSLDNIPASAIERIEIINNPSARYDANGNAGIINIIYKKNKQEGFNGKIGLTTGLGALWVRKENFPGIRPQSRNTLKLNPSVALNYKKGKVNIFFQGDYLHTPTLNKNEFTDRYYDSGDTIRQQLKRNRSTNVITSKAGVDWNWNEQNALSVSALFSSEKILDRGDQPFFNAGLTQRRRLWQFLEDELKTTMTATASYQHKYQQPGRLLNVGFNYTFHREDEKYFFTNMMPDFTGQDAFKLLSDENVFDLNADYIRPLRYGRFEGGLKLRRRFIPTNMQFFPGLNSPLDSLAGGWANYKETIPALYGNYVFENRKFELEAGLRVEYINLRYTVNPTHPTYKSDGYSYAKPFPNVRLAYKLNEHDKISLFYNRRVDRPNEVDIRIFPKYDDAEIIKIGNPALKPQFTSSLEAGYKTSWASGSIYAAAYHKQTNGTITRIGTTVPGSTLIYNIFQNAGKSYASGGELVWQQDLASWFSLNVNGNLYHNSIDAFTVENLYPVRSLYRASRQELTSGSAKINGLLKGKKTELQVAFIYQAPDIVPQGRTGYRFSVDAGAKRQLRKGELFVNATDLFGTLVIRKTVYGDGFHYTSRDYYETQLIRAGYSFKF
ncbi:outer membrane beta-barrel family protein [Dyadobacter psychrophilus]|uniref:Outer membrane receptor proteins, mostly Fe transport n=1 Tax=Dyadobacter psychrophilus TaxID=651661 RepID=A0A1T5DEC7_9BACT|nr:outer membrane beta-barrel family protein [Dyadobacter psychrophilus]SKB70045.1 Outer membrane receptor proteins, mostly Fe transport [Dyadobacter psychrophilus]